VPTCALCFPNNSIAPSIHLLHSLSQDILHPDQPGHPFLIFAIFIKVHFSPLIMSKNNVVERSNSSREEDGYELPNWSQLGGTDADEHDMQMLGRTQQLNVRILWMWP
jgi:hypothetical protein